MLITDVEIVHIKVNHRGNWIFLNVQTDEGITGISEASHSGNDDLLDKEVIRLGVLLRGKDPAQIHKIIHELLKVDGGRIHQTAISALETALWDILGQRANKSVANLFGGPLKERLPLYANINRSIKDRSPKGFAYAAEQAVKEGFKAIKIAPFDEISYLSRGSSSKADWRPGLERIRTVQKAVGSEIEVSVDCHRRFNYATFLPLLDELNSLDLFWLEEPIKTEKMVDVQKLSQKIKKPLAGGERLFGLQGFNSLLTERSYDILMPDVKHTGGLWELKNIGEACRINSLLFSPHNPAGPLATAASAQVAAIVSSFSILEYAWGEADWRAQLLEPPERIVDGMLVLSEHPGIGHKLNQEFIKRYRI